MAKKAETSDGAGISPDLAVHMLRAMHEIRAFEEKVAYFFARGKIHGTTHLYVGEEATAVGVISALEPDDLMTSTHRGHGHTIAKGIDLNRMMAELLGKRTGYCKGKGGSMHIADLDLGNLGANGIVGGGIPVATGAGLSLRMQGRPGVVVCFFGDGAANEGTFHESLNMASIWDLPVLYVCENNQYGMSMSQKRSMNVDDISVRAQAYGIPGLTVDGNDAVAVFEATRAALDHVRATGPYLLVANTYRFMGHSKSDANKYRTKEEIEEWKKRDPIPRFVAWAAEQKLITQEQAEGIEREARESIEAAVAFAEKSDEPGLDDLTTDVYA
jgi:pyruvate dehydrogenase E1 component alpha subunit